MAHSAIRQVKENNGAGRFFGFKKTVCPIFLLIILLVWFKDVLFLDNIFCFGDIPRYYYPLREFVRELIKNGKIPLWNPYIFCGNPLFATLQSQVFYPISIIFYLLPAAKGFNIYTVLHIYLAGVFIYILLRYWRLSRYASFISALLYSLSGFMISSIHMNTTISSIIWLPLIMYFFEKTLNSKRIKYLLLTSIFLCIQFFGGEPTSLIYTVYLIFFYSIWYSWTEYKKPKIVLMAALSVSAICLIAFLLAAVQAIPFLEFLKTTTKFSGSTFEKVSKWSLHPKELANFIVPFAYGNISRPGECFGAQMWLVGHYMGLGCLILVGICLFGRKERRTRFWIAVLAVALLMSLGGYTPFFGFIYKVFPLIKLNRYPVKYMSLVTFCMAVLAGFGMEKVLTGKIEGKKMTRVLLIINTVLGGVIILCALFWQDIFSSIIKYCYPRGIEEWKLGKLSGITAKNLMYIYQGIILFFTASLLLIWKNKYKSAGTGFFGFFFALLILLDISSANKDIGKIAPAKTFLSETENIKIIKNDKTIFRVARSKPLDDFNNVVYGHDYTQGLQERKDSLTANTMMLFRIFDMAGYDSVVREDIQNVYNLINTQKSLDDTKVLNMLNVKYLATVSPLAANGYEKLIDKKFSAGQACISENRNVLPRVFLTEIYKVVKTRKEALEYISKKEFDPSKEAVIEEDIKTEKFLRNETGSVKIISYKPGKIIIGAHLNRPSFLVLSESWYPGWNVYVNGVKGTLYRINYMLMGARLGKGDFSVRFAYEPITFKAGLVISLTTLPLLIIILWLSRKKTNS